MTEAQKSAVSDELKTEERYVRQMMMEALNALRSHGISLPIDLYIWWGPSGGLPRWRWSMHVARSRMAAADAITDIVIGPDGAVLKDKWADGVGLASAVHASPGGAGISAGGNGRAGGGGGGLVNKLDEHERVGPGPDRPRQWPTLFTAAQNHDIKGDLFVRTTVIGYDPHWSMADNARLAVESHAAGTWADNELLTYRADMVRAMLDYARQHAPNPARGAYRLASETPADEVAAIIADIHGDHPMVIQAAHLRRIMDDVAADAAHAVVGDDNSDPERSTKTEIAVERIFGLDVADGIRITFRPALDLDTVILGPIIEAARKACDRIANEDAWAAEIGRDQTDVLRALATAERIREARERSAPVMKVATDTDLSQLAFMYIGAMSGKLDKAIGKAIDGTRQMIEDSVLRVRVSSALTLDGYRSVAETFLADLIANPRRVEEITVAPNALAEIILAERSAAVAAMRPVVQAAADEHAAMKAKPADLAGWLDMMPPEVLATSPLERVAAIRIAGHILRDNYRFADNIRQLARAYLAQAPEPETPPSQQAGVGNASAGGSEGRPVGERGGVAAPSVPDGQPEGGFGLIGHKPGGGDILALMREKCGVAASIMVMAATGTVGILRLVDEEARFALILDIEELTGRRLPDDLFDRPDRTIDAIVKEVLASPMRTTPRRDIPTGDVDKMAHDPLGR